MNDCIGRMDGWMVNGKEEIEINREVKVKVRGPWVLSEMDTPP